MPCAGFGWNAYIGARIAKRVFWKSTQACQSRAGYYLYAIVTLATRCRAYMNILNSPELRLRGTLHDHPLQKFLANICDPVNFIIVSNDKSIDS